MSQGSFCLRLKSQSTPEGRLKKAELPMRSHKINQTFFFSLGKKKEPYSQGKNGCYWVKIRGPAAWISAPHPFAAYQAKRQSTAL